MKNRKKIDMKILQKGTSRYGMLLCYKDIINNYRINLFGIILLELVAFCYYLINPFFLQIFTEQIIIGHKANMLNVVCIGSVSLYVLYCILDYLSKLLRITTVNEIILQIKKKCMLTLLRDDNLNYAKYSIGDIEHIFGEDFLILDKYFNNHVIDYTICILFLLFTTIGMIIVNWRLLIISGIIIPIPYLVIKLIGRINYVRIKERREIYGEYEGFLLNGLRLWSTIKLLNIQKQYMKKFLKYRHRIAKFDIQSGYLEYIGKMVEFISEILATRIIIYLVGGFMVINKNISIGNLLVFISYFEFFYKQIKQINQWQYEISSDMPSLNKIKDLVYIDREYSSDEKIYLKGNITFKNVSFSYDNGIKVLEKINIKICAGEKIALVGENGCGKTTIIKLLLKFYQVDSGEILLDDYRINDLTYQNIAGNIGTVLQNFNLFDMSMGNNLRMFAIDENLEKIKDVCRKVGLSEYIDSLPDKYDTFIGENGSNLSGGQRQKLALARLLLKEKSIIVLDEVSSAIDLEAERDLFEEIFGYFKHSTILFISHRKAPLLFADRIIILDQGRIVGIGKHEELIENNRYYQKLFL